MPLTPEMQHQLETEGYIILNDFLASSELKQLQDLVNTAPLPNKIVDYFGRSLYKSAGSTYPMSGYTILSERSLDFRRHHNNTIKEIVNSKLATLLPRHRAVFCTWYRKAPNSDTNPELLHQDASNSDESAHSCFGLWFPLTDVNLNNGCLHAIKGSHHLNSQFRPDVGGGAYSKEIFTLLGEHYLIPIPLQAGSAVLYDKRLFHSSTANRSSTERVAFTCIVTPNEIPIQFGYRKEGSDIVDLYEVDEDFFNRYIDGDLPSESGARYIKSQTYTRDLLTPEIIERKISPFYPSQSVSWITWIRKKLNQVYSKVPDQVSDKSTMAIQSPKTSIISSTPDMHGQLRAEGYVVLENFLTSKELQDLWKLIETIPLPKGTVTIFNGREHLKARKAHNEGIKKIISPKLDTLLPNYRTALCTWYRKGPQSTNNATPLHHDPSHTIEPGTLSFGIWFPLIDVDPSNGCLHIVKGSHCLNSQPRPFSPFIPLSAIPLPNNEEVSAILSEHYLTPIPLKSGQAILYDKRLIHSATPNLTAIERIACTCVISPIGQPTQIAYMPTVDAKNIEIYEVDDEFYNHHIYDDRPNGEGVRFIKTQPYTHDPLTLELIAQKLGPLHRQKQQPTLE